TSVTAVLSSRAAVVSKLVPVVTPLAAFLFQRPRLLFRRGLVAVPQVAPQLCALPPDALRVAPDLAPVLSQLEAIRSDCVTRGVALRKRAHRKSEHQCAGRCNRPLHIVLHGAPRSIAPTAAMAVLSVPGDISAVRRRVQASHAGRGGQTRAGEKFSARRARPERVYCSCSELRPATPRESDACCRSTLSSRRSIPWRKTRALPTAEQPLPTAVN